MLQAPSGLRHAVCLTGLERDFPIVGSNVREFLFRLLGTPEATVTFFGVKPQLDPWHNIFKLLPMHIVEAQEGMCLPQHLLDTIRSKRRMVRWLHCSNRGRNDCSSGFVMELCDLAHCEAMISKHEGHLARRFDTVYRLRADLAMEAPLKFPSPFLPATLYVPWMNCANGTNDQAAFGYREAMSKYLTRIRYITPNISVAKLQQGLPFKLGGRDGTVSSEAFLKAALYHDWLQALELPGWMYCIHTFKAYMDGSAKRGCIARMRERFACRSLVCMRDNIKYYCNCHSDPCNRVMSGALVSNWDDPLGKGRKSLLWTFRMYTRQWRARMNRTLQDLQDSDGVLLHSCSNVDGRQLHLHSCPMNYTSVGRKAKPKYPHCTGQPCSIDGAALLRGVELVLSDLPACAFENGLNSTLYPRTFPEPFVTGNRLAGVWGGHRPPGRPTDSTPLLLSRPPTDFGATRQTTIRFEVTVSSEAQKDFGSEGFATSMAAYLSTGGVQMCRQMFFSTDGQMLVRRSDVNLTRSVASIKVVCTVAVASAARALVSKISSLGTAPLSPARPHDMHPHDPKLPVLSVLSVTVE